MEHTFKSSLFGGFNRDDVIRYIEKAALESKERIEALEKENNALCHKNSELRNEVSSAAQARDYVSASHQTLSEEHEHTKAALAEAEAQLAAARDSLVALEKENAALRSSVTELEKTANEYRAVRSHISDIELQARQRADELEERTHRQLSELLDSCRQRCEEITSMLNASCVGVSGELQKLDASVAQLPAAFDTLHAGLEDLEKLK